MSGGPGMNEREEVPAEAVEAAARAFRETHFMDDALMNALKAAAPYMKGAGDE